jgi:uncharacterized membrane protein
MVHSFIAACDWHLRLKNSLSINNTRQQLARVMMFYPAIVAYISTAIVFFAADFVWLSKMTGLFYRARMGNMLLDQPNFAVAGLFYLFYVAGIVYLAVLPALNNSSWSAALLSGAVLGLVAYGTYDMTNLSTLKNWSVSLSVVDMAWGTFLTAIASTAGYFVTSFIMTKMN